MKSGFRRARAWGLFLVFSIALLTGFALTACAISYDHATWRYKMTVTVETPEGLKTGSAVREVSASREPKIFPEQSSGHAGLTKGEAVVVDLGKRGVLFALIRGGTTGEDYGYYVVFNAFPYPAGHGGGQLTSGGINFYSHLKAGPVELSPKEYPMFVHFRDIKDPKTVEAVSATNTEDKPSYTPEETIKTFASAFGKGVSLKSVTIEMTRGPVTWGIEKWLPWLPSMAMSYLNGEHHSRGAPLGLAGDAFIVGVQSDDN